MTIGDSVMYDGEAGIRAAMQATGEVAVTPHGFDGWGLHQRQELPAATWPGPSPRTIPR